MKFNSLEKTNVKNLYDTTFKVRSYEVDHNGETTLPHICNYFQEAAGLHAYEMQFDISDLFKKGMTWVLYQLHVKVYKYPKRWESVTVQTWPSAGEGIRAFRDYELKNSSGKTIAVGLSQWMVLDLKTKRPVKIPDEILKFGAGSDVHVLENNRTSIDSLPDNQSRLITRVGRQDLDMNNHVNNVKFIEWITGHHQDNALKCRELKIQFLSEAQFGDNIYLSQEIEREQGIQSATHTLFRQDPKNVIAKSNSVWQ